MHLMQLNFIMTENHEVMKYLTKIRSGRAGKEEKAKDKDMYCIYNYLHIMYMFNSSRM